MLHTAAQFLHAFANLLRLPPHGGMAIVLDVSPRGANFSGPNKLLAGCLAPFVSAESGFQLGAYTPSFDDQADSTLTPLWFFPGRGPPQGVRGVQGWGERLRTETKPPPHI